MRHSIFAAAVLAGSLLAAAPGYAMDAEFAFRWDPSLGGPRAARDVVALLAPDAELRQDRFVMRYATDAKAPEGMAVDGAILRLRHRTNKSRFELTYKVRSDGPLTKEPTFADNECPAGKGSGAAKDELDIAFGDADVKRVYSRSCTVTSKAAAPPTPTALNVHFAACESTMTRLTIKTTKVAGLKIEEWSLPDGHRAIEVSRTARDTQGAIAAFKADVVEPLSAVGARALAGSKTELGSKCAG